MSRYLLKLSAVWVTGWEYSSGERDGSSTYTEEKELFLEAEELEPALEEAAAHVKKFWEYLPKMSTGSLSWQNEDPKMSALLLCVTPFDWEEVLDKSEEINPE